MPSLTSLFGPEPRHKPSYRWPTYFFGARPWLDYPRARRVPRTQRCWCVGAFPVPSPLTSQHPRRPRSPRSRRFRWFLGWPLSAFSPSQPIIVSLSAMQQQHERHEFRTHPTAPGTRLYSCSEGPRTCTRVLQLYTVHTVSRPTPLRRKQE